MDSTAFIIQLNNSLISAMPSSSVETRAIVIAQAGLESGWGASAPSSVFNYWNLSAGKYWKGPVQLGGDLEYAAGDSVPIKIVQRWRAYADQVAACIDYFEFLHYGVYATALKLLLAGDIESIEAMGTAGFYTDPHYFQKYVPCYLKVTVALGIQLSRCNTPASVGLSSLDTPLDPTNDYKRISTIKDQQTLAAVNMQATTAVDNKGLGTLRETTGTGYVNGTSSTITLIQVGSVRVEKFTGYDFLLMQASAQKNGISLTLVNGFRDVATQTQLFNERNIEPAKSAKGAVVPSGSDPHQSGKAIDINVNMTLAQKITKNFSPVYAWLLAFAADFGFTNQVLPNPSFDEPWHWIHVANQLVFTGDVSALRTSPIVSTSAAGAVTTTGQPTPGTQAAKDLYDRTKAFERSYQAARTTRDTHIASQAQRAILSSAAINNMAAQMGVAITQAVARLPSPFDTLSTKSEAFDFDTGLWGAGGLV